MLVKYTRLAEAAYLEAVSYLRERNPSAARDFVLEVRKREEQLLAFPLSGSYVPEFPTSVYKQVFVKPYRFFYRVEDDTVWIVAIYYERQIPAAPN